MADGNDSKVVSSLIWKYLERIGAQGVSFVLTLILANFLTPDDYGIVALLTVFISLANVFVQCGFNTALIQKPHVDNRDYSVGLCVSAGISIVVYIILYAAAPLISEFYKKEQLCIITRVLALVIIPGGLNAIQIAKLSREMKFKKMFSASFEATLFSAGIGIFLAWRGFGPWALVYQQISYQVVSCLLMGLSSRWKFDLTGWKGILKEILPFGSRVLLNNLIITLYLDLRTIIIGGMYSSADLGLFNRGKQFPQAIMESINGTIQSVMLPVYSRAQDDRPALIAMVRKSVQLSTFVIYPILIGLACVAKPLVALILPSVWSGCVPYLQIFTVSYLCMPFQITAAQAMRSIGDSKGALRMEVIKKVVETILLLGSLRYGVMAIALTSAIGGILSVVIAVVANVISLRYPVQKQIWDITENMLYTIIMAVSVMYVMSLFQSPGLQLLIGALTGLASYILSALVFRSGALRYLCKMTKNFTNR